ncbi:MAG: glycosyltransferase family 39 protein [Saprospiraceae bacterium]|nr:glycosyltransferase family 39 protein [Saprospiraceae bacterium]MCF8252135.1 glycosyltransferase family 39 protein [Saprospiraceae bacterium]MCF8281859.1 glycosyltransferase family 39 protein [Bacteroidales bacterium]MCF8313787.1 glycosyltransferase family 39 protein [Saprospiraceae bacterium]MCF8442510.1 glycosyltransferase family 39 protein [Saprospiraceae bacterium]
MMDKPWHKYLIFGLYCVAIYFPVFLHLDWQLMNNWDESLFAMRAAYMSEEGHYLRDYSLWVDGGMLHRSTKPPFTTWLQVLSFKAFGINELALRLPIALCTLGLTMLFPWFSRKKLGSVNLGYCAGFVLVTSLGFVREHGSRTGDQDAALAFYMLAGAMAFYNYLDAAEQRKRHGWLVVFTIATIAAVMTKYAFGLLFFPAFLIYAVHKKQLWNLLKRGSTWLALLAVVLSLGGWLAYIEHQLPGFVDRAFHHEMADRYSESYAGHDHPFNYYFIRLWEKNYFMPWLFLLVSPLFLLFSKQRTSLQDFSLLMFLCAAVELLVVSLSKTKTDHYDMVAYPPMAMLAGVGLYQLGLAIRQLWQEKSHRSLALTAAIFGTIVLLIMPYQAIIERVYKPKMSDRTMSYGYLLRKMQKKQPGIKQFTILAPVYTGQVNYYTGLLNRKKGYKIKMSEHPKLVEVGDTVVACEPKMLDSLRAHYELKVIETEERCILAIAKGKKELGIGN